MKLIIEFIVGFSIFYMSFVFTLGILKEITSAFVRAIDKYFWR